jgi:pyruvate/2-oxoglutarate dehydrogenase complex dihydrolipoamide acyltransferase (E2) component
MAGYSAGKCEVIPLDRMRHVIMEVIREGRRWNQAHGLIQIDITPARRKMDKMKATGDGAPSMTGYIIHCLARAVDENKTVHAIRKGMKMHVFEDIDVSTVIERETPGGDAVPASMIIRRANRKTLREIHAEIRFAETTELDGTALGGSEEAKRTNLFLKLPRLVRKLVWWWTRQSPQFRKENMGTVHVTSVGMFSDSFDAGWAIPVAPWPLIISVGTISRRLVLGEDGTPTEQEHLNVTLTIDHDVVDGGPATRFLMRFRQLLQTGYGLDDFNGQS